MSDQADNALYDLACYSGFEAAKAQAIVYMLRDIRDELYGLRGK